MNRRAAARRRYRVVARPRERARRARLFGAACATLILGGVAAVAARHAVGLWTRARALIPAALPAAPEAVAVSGVPEPLRSLFQKAADAVAGSAGEKAAALRRQFPCIADVAVRRAWGEKSATLDPALRRAIAPALRGGKAAGFLSEDGVVFAAPVGAYALSGPSVDVGTADPEELKSLARVWPALSAAGAFPAPLSELERAADGWRVKLGDGTTALWGRLDWTKEKLARMGEALSDARARTPGAFAVDLRYFEDGKILLKPLGPQMKILGGAK